MRLVLVVAALLALPTAAVAAQPGPATPNAPAGSYRSMTPQPGDRCYLPPLPPKPVSLRLQAIRSVLNDKSLDRMAVLIATDDDIDAALDEQFRLDLQWQQLLYQRALLLAERGCPPEK